MLTAEIGTLTLNSIASLEDPALESRYGFPLYSGTGTTNSAVVYFEIEPGKRLGMHNDSAEEIILILEGTAEATVNGETGILRTGGMAVVPTWAPHDVANAGDTTLRVVGFFAGATLVHTFHEPIIPGAEIAVIIHDQQGESAFAGAPLPAPAAV